MQDINFVTPSTRFKCKRCTKCCHLDVLLSDGEMASFGKFSDIKWHSTKKVFGKNGLVCCFLNHTSCTIYKKRPKFCRMYPFSTVPESDLIRLGINADDLALRIPSLDGQRYLIIYDEECPGIGTGDVCNWSETFGIQ